MIRFEILLPLYYNDGTLVEPENFVATDDELVQVFGAISTDQIAVELNRSAVVTSLLHNSQPRR